MKNYMLIDTETGELLNEKPIRRDEPNHWPAANHAEVLLATEPRPPIDSATQVMSPNRRAEPWPFVKDVTQWVEGWTVRAKTDTELSIEKDRETDRVTNQVLGKVLFRMANDIRALESKTPLTAAQFRTFVRGLLNG